MWKTTKDTTLPDTTHTPPKKGNDAASNGGNGDVVALKSALQEAKESHELTLRKAAELEKTLQEAKENHELTLRKAAELEKTLQEAKESHELTLHKAAELEKTLQEAEESHDLTLRKAAEREAALQEEAKESRELALRKAAEIENLRRRAGWDIENAVNSALEKLALEMCEVHDCFVSAIIADDKASQSKKPRKGIWRVFSRDKNPVAANQRKGLELTMQKMESALKASKILPIAPEVGGVFDPELHQSVATEANSKLPENAITGVLQAGYTINNRLLRPAIVTTNKVPSTGGSTAKKSPAKDEATKTNNKTNNKRKSNGKNNRN